MNNLICILLMAPPEGDSPYSSFIFLAAIILIFYFFMIRPQMKKQKDSKKFREELKKGDKVLTTGGIYGKLAEIREKVVILEVEDKVRLKVDKTAIIKDSTDLTEKK